MSGWLSTRAWHVPHIEGAGMVAQSVKSADMGAWHRTAETKGGRDFERRRRAPQGPQRQKRG